LRYGCDLKSRTTEIARSSGSASPGEVRDHADPVFGKPLPTVSHSIGTDANFCDSGGSSPTMRISMLTPEYPPDWIGGVATHTYTMARALVAAGHEVQVITPGTPGVTLEGRCHRRTDQDRQALACSRKLDGRESRSRESRSPMAPGRCARRGVLCHGLVAVPLRSATYSYSASNADRNRG